MKTLTTTTFAITLMALGFVGIVATPAQAGEGLGDDRTIYTYDDRHQLKDCTWTENEDSLKLCRKTDEDGNERVAGIEVPDHWTQTGSKAIDGGQVASSGSDWSWWLICMRRPELCNGDESTEDSYGNTEEIRSEQFAGCVTRQDGSVVCPGDSWKFEESQGEQFAGGSADSVVCEPDLPAGEYHECVNQFSEGEIDSIQRLAGYQNNSRGKVGGGDINGGEYPEPVKTASGTFYPLPMLTVAEMDKLLAPGGTSVASFDKILAPGGTAVESEHQFADREDGAGGGDFGESSGGDFGEGDRAAASTAAE